MKRKQVLIIDYGMGNVNSVCNALDFLQGAHKVSNHIEDVKEADAYILPGVGAFGAAMANLRGLGIVDELNTQVTLNKKPFLGICLGMQLLAIDSTEYGFHHGFGWINAHVRELPRATGIRLPHVGWNNLTVNNSDPLLANIDSQANFYFDHTYHFVCQEYCVAAECFYGRSFVAAIHKDNIFATQFHPEKSQRSGLKLLRNYLNFIEAHTSSLATLKGARC